jgi:hypothetical protein
VTAATISGIRRRAGEEERDTDDTSLVSVAEAVS